MAWAAVAIGGATLVGGLLSSNAQKSAAGEAAGAQTRAAELGIEEQRREFDAIQQILAPYVQQGSAAVSLMGALAGLPPAASTTTTGAGAAATTVPSGRLSFATDNGVSTGQFVQYPSLKDALASGSIANAQTAGPETPWVWEPGPNGGIQYVRNPLYRGTGEVPGAGTAPGQAVTTAAGGQPGYAPTEQQAIADILAGPEYGAYLKEGENAILQNASATGGLRGGNVQASLAKFRPTLLAQLINDRFNRLGQIAGLGQASAAGQASAGLQTGTNIANLYGQQGAAQAGQALAVGQANANLWGNVAGSISDIATLKALKVF